MAAGSQIAATLFYDRAPTVSLGALEEQLRAAFAEHQIRARPRYSTDTDLSIGLGRLTISITRHPAPVDLQPFIGATAAGSEFGISPARQRALVAHRGAVQLRVTGPVGAALEPTRVAVCFLATLEVLAQGAPLMIHWAKSQSLYTPEEFYHQSSTTAGPQRRAPLAPQAEGRDEGAQARALEQLRLDALRERCFPANEIRTRRSDRRALAVRLHVQAGAMLMSAAVLASWAAAQAMSAVQLL